jgi:hypothetical protein
MNASSSSSTPTMDNEKLQFMGKILSDFGGAASSVLVYIGVKLGLYKAMSDFGKPITSRELANLTVTSERYIREWLANQAAGGYLTYEPATQRYILPFENAQVLANEESPVYAVGGFHVLMSFYRDEAKILEAFKTARELLGEIMIKTYLKEQENLRRSYIQLISSAHGFLLLIMVRLNRDLGKCQV